MNYGLYLSAAGAVANLHRQNVLANNLANVETIGFKPDLLAQRQRLPERLEDPSRFADPQELLERLGGGTSFDPTIVSLQQGALRRTDRDLDVAVSGAGFLVAGDGTAEGSFLTRDGRLTVDAEGRLALATSGLPLLDESNRPVAIDPARTVDIRADGTVVQDGETVARLRFVAPSEARDLRKVGRDLLRIEGASALDAPAATGRLEAGHLEGSAVEPITTMTDLMAASKAAEANLRMIQYQDQLLGQMINTMGRVN